MPLRFMKSVIWRFGDFELGFGFQNCLFNPIEHIRAVLNGTSQRSEGAQDRHKLLAAGVDNDAICIIFPSRTGRHRGTQASVGRLIIMCSLMQLGIDTLCKVNQKLSYFGVITLLCIAVITHVPSTIRCPPCTGNKPGRLY